MRDNNILYRKRQIQNYFHAWLKKDRTAFCDIFSDDMIYSECYGPEYHGLKQMERWFDEWNERGTVIAWDIKHIFQEDNFYAVEWFFQCIYDNNMDGFDGVSLVEFNEDNKIVSIKEFQSKAEHYFPYE